MFDSENELIQRLRTEADAIKTRYERLRANAGCATDPDDDYPTMKRTIPLLLEAAQEIEALKSIQAMERQIIQNDYLAIDALKKELSPLKQNNEDLSIVCLKLAEGAYPFLHGDQILAKIDQMCERVKATRKK